MSKQKKQHTGLHRVLLVLTSILLVVALAANVAGVYFAETIDNYVTGTHLDTSEKATAAVMETGEKVAEQIAAEGAVLLKNDGALPLASDVTKVNVFGWGSTQWLGSGSGSGRVVSTDTGLLDALEAAGIDYNSELTDMYKAFQPERPYASNQVGTLNSWPEQSCRLYEPDINDTDYYTTTMLENAKAFSDTAIVVFNRFAGESNDCPQVQYKQTTKDGDIIVDESRTYLDLSTEEEDLLTYVGENYENVIVLLNTGNVMAVGQVESIPGVDACLMVGLTGTNAATAIPKLLWGDINPSGRTADTWAYRFDTAASYANAGLNGVGVYSNADGLYPADGTTMGNLGESNYPYTQVSYVDYAEGIYVGYKWYETADAEGYWDTVSNEYGNGYEGVVQYPFGYGLSYTDFDWEVTDASANVTSLTKDGEVTVKVKVTNTRAMTDNVKALNLYTAEMAEDFIKDTDEPVTTGAKNGLKVEEDGYITELGYQLGKNYDDPQWDSLLDQLTKEEMENLYLHGYVRNNELPSIGKPTTREVDGPSQAGSFNQASFGTGYPNAGTMAQTWNAELAGIYGQSIGQQAAHLGYDGLYAPATNMHRSPFDGRNYEYYSEDSLLSGTMCGKTVEGAKQAGIYMYVKHFICNDGESGMYRDAVYTWMTEQALREIYLKPFQMLVEDYGATALMSSYNRIGAVWAGGSEALLTSILRDEWGFHGAVVTDYSDHQNYMNGDQSLRAGGSLWMDGWLSNGAFFCETSSNTYMQQLRRAAKNVIYMYLNARAVNQDYAQTVDASILKPATIPNFAWWKCVLGAVDVVVVLLFALSVRAVAKDKKRKGENGGI